MNILKKTCFTACHTHGIRKGHLTRKRKHWSLKRNDTVETLSKAVVTVWATQSPSQCLQVAYHQEALLTILAVVDTHRPIYRSTPT